MNIARFFEHWGLTENPFSAEEARHDAVFARLAPGVSTHPDFEKVLGDLSRPATSIVFGEKGSGKTALRMQIEQRILAWNETHPDRCVLLIAYDDLNPTLDRFVARMREEGSASTDEALAKLRLTDHMDAILHSAVAPIVDGLLAATKKTGRDRVRALRRSAPSVRADCLLLQAVYDRPASAPANSIRLRRMLRARGDWSRALWTIAAGLGWIPAAALAGWLVFERTPAADPAWTYGVGTLAAAWALTFLKRFGWDRWRVRRLGRRVARRVRVQDRSPDSAARSLACLSPAMRAQAPMTGSEETRYEMFARLRRVIAPLGYTSAIVVVDRVDEPTVISGDPDRMRAVVWSLMSSKFLQMEGVGFKLLLPIELRHALFRESSKFFQEARLDKQNLIEQLAWTGATLYDLCTARMRACRRGNAGSVTLVDFFAEDVARQDVVDALDQMRQPRDAFKLLYQCAQAHCATVTEDQAENDGAWRIPRLILETVRRSQVDRVLQLSRGMRPA